MSVVGKKPFFQNYYARTTGKPFFGGVLCKKITFFPTFIVRSEKKETQKVHFLFNIFRAQAIGLGTRQVWPGNPHAAIVCSAWPPCVLISRTCG